MNDKKTSNKAFYEALEKAKTGEDFRAAIKLLPKSEVSDKNNGMPTIEEVGEWLEENVLVCPEPKIITLSNFRQKDLGGEFTLTLDSVTLIDSISFDNWPLNSSLISIYMPMFHSPLGVPASYAAIEITDNTRKLIVSTLRKAWKDGKINESYSARILVES